MPQPSAIETALVVIAIAVTVQTLLMVAVCVTAFVAWRRVGTALSTTSADLHARLDEMAEQVRATTARVNAVAGSFERVVDGAEAMAGGARRVAGDVGSALHMAVRAVATPPALLALAGRMVLARWRRGHA